MEQMATSTKKKGPKGAQNSGSVRLRRGTADVRLSLGILGRQRFEHPSRRTTLDTTRGSRSWFGGEPVVMALESRHADPTARSAARENIPPSSWCVSRQLRTGLGDKREAQES